MKRRDSESGQSSIEAVVALFVLVLLFFGTVSIAITAYSVVDANARIQKAGWSLDAAALAAAPDKNAFVRTALIANVPGLPLDNLSVSNADVRVRNVDAARALGAQDARYGISEIAQTKQVADVSFDVSFAAPNLLPGLPSPPEQRRHVAHEMVLDQKVEVR